MLRKAIVHCWEPLDESTSRCRVPHGWLVLHTDRKNKSESMVFLADKDKEWKIGQPEPEIKAEEVPY